MGRDSEEMRLWLFDLAHGMLEDDQNIKGFLKHYAIHGFVIENIYDDILHHTAYRIEGIKTAKESVEQALGNYIKGEQLK